MGYYITGFSFIESGIIMIFKTRIYTLNLFLAINIQFRVPVFSSIVILTDMLHSNIILVLCT